jgi:acyl carrier protein
MAEVHSSRSWAAALEHGLLPSEGVEVFARILESRLPQVLVSTLSLSARIEQSRSGEKELFDREERRSDARHATHPRPDLSTTYVAPRNDLEQTLHAIWEQLLGIEQIGVYDNFFELGGHSLLGVQLISRLRDQFHIEMPMGSIFEQPTIAGLSDRISIVKWATKQELPAAMNAAEREEIEL